MRDVPTPSLWGIGAYRVGAEAITYPIGHEDHQRDVGSAVAVMSALGVARGGRVLVVSLLSEGGQYWPVQLAVLAAGAQLSCADATRSDAFRVAMFLRSYDYQAVVGVNSEVVEGLEELGSPLREVFARAGVVAARPGAHERLRAAGLEPRWWIPAGPAIAVECDGRQGAHVDGAEWALDVDGDEILITARRPRAAVVDRQPTGLRGQVATDVCTCGRADPRIVLAAA